MQPFRLRDLTLYFFKLGLTGFGGPIALIGYMQHDLVEKRKWFPKEDYLHGVALAQLVPGPVAMQLAIYFGYLKGKILGATTVAIAFIFFPFLFVWALSWLYVQYHGLPWIHSLFYGMSAAVIGVIIKAAVNLAKIALEKKIALWLIAILITFLTAYTGRVSILFFLASGLAALLIYAFPLRGRLFLAPPWELFFFFMKAAVVVYGSGMAIIPFIYGDVVEGYGWLTNQEFLDAVSVGMITPGPVLITVGFIGYMVGGFYPSLLSVVGVFIPVYLFVIVFAPFFRKIIRNKQVKAFVNGVTAAATGAIVGSVWLLGKNALVDLWTILIAVMALLVLLKTKLPVPLLLLLGGMVGLGIKFFSPA